LLACVHFTIFFSPSLFPLFRNFKGKGALGTSLKCSISERETPLKVTFRVTKLGRYVIVDVGGNRVTFRALNVRLKIKKKNETPRIMSLGRL